MKKILLLLLFVLTRSQLQSQVNIFNDSVFTAGTTYNGAKSYITYYAGNLPLIFSAPHGGSLLPGEIPDRTYGVTATDSRTREMAQYVFQELKSLTGKYPHVIVNNLRRLKLDPNRDSVEGAQGNESALWAWKEYQSFIAVSRNTVNKEYGKGFYVDLHGHGHSIQRLELGYLLSASELNKSNFELNNGNYGNKSSIKSLAANNPRSLLFADLLRGDYSMGAFFENAGIPAVPSSKTLSPENDPYFSGGYCTQLYGSLYGGSIDGVQIEHNFNGLRDSDANVRAYAKKLSEIVLEYFKYHYNLDLTTDVNGSPELTTSFELAQNFPNPFNPETTIKFSVPYFETLHSTPFQLVNLTVYDVLGRKIATLLNEEKSPGVYEVKFDGIDLPSGIYIYQLRTNGFSISKKMILLK